MEPCLKNYSLLLALVLAPRDITRQATLLTKLGHREGLQMS